MATVTGYTAARMKEIEDAAIIDGNVVGNDLILVRHDGTQINAGNVRGIQGETGTTGDTAILVVTSASRPPTPYTGQFIYETDTHRLHSWNGSAWIYRGGVIICTSTTRPVSAFSGLSIYETDTNRPYTWDGTAWIYKGGIVLCTAATRPASPFTGLSIFETDTLRPYTWNGASWVYRGGTILCTSTTRPASPFTGLSIYETDTNRPYIWDGTAWIYRGGLWICTSTTRPTSPFTGLSIYETDTGRTYTWQNTAWMFNTGINTMRCRVNRNSSQLVGSASISMITWTGEDYDSDNMWSPGGSADRIYIPSVGGAGYWRVSLTAQFALNATGGRHISILLNGGALGSLNAPGSASWYSGGTVTHEIQAPEGAYFSAAVYQNSGVALNIDIAYPINMSVSRFA